MYRENPNMKILLFDRESGPDRHINKALIY